MNDRPLRGVWAAVSLSLAITVQVAAQQASPALDRQAAMQSFLAEHPGAAFFEEGGRITRVYGEAFGGGSSPEEAADAFRLQYAPIFGVPAADLDPRGPLADQRHTLPLMYDDQTGTYKFTLVYYTQWRDGLPVYQADVRILARNEANHPVVLVSSGLRDLGGFLVDAAIKNELANKEQLEARYAEAIRSVQAFAANLANFSPAEVVIWAGVDAMTVQPTTALSFIADNFPAGGAGDAKWRIIADLTTGAILHKEFLLHTTDVTGSVKAMVTQGGAADYCDPESLTALPFAQVSIGATNAFADASGNFVIPNAGTSAVTVDSQVRGQWFVVAASEDMMQSVTPPGPANFVHNQLNTDPLLRAQGNAYYHANVVRSMTLAAHPTYPTLMNPSFPINVNQVGGLCPGNAWYDPGAVSLNFCQAGGNYPNTAWTSVIYHEYGHHLVAAGGSGQGAYGEGMGDCISILLLDDNRLGLGFFVSSGCSVPLRDPVANFRSYPCAGEIHDCGQLISGCLWGTRNSLIVSEPINYLTILRDLTINSIPMHTGSTIAPDITIDFLTLDDDDANLNNGTPHYSAICTGFNAHAMTCPALSLIAFNYPNGKPAFIPPNQVFNLRVDVVPLSGTPIPNSGTLSYRIGSSGAFTTVAMNSIGTNQYNAPLPATACPQQIQYYVSAQAVGPTTVSDPTNAPTSFFSTVAASGTSTLVSYNFETNPGWTVSGAPTDGPWDANPGIPVNCVRGDPNADYDGSSRCWMTDNSAASACNSDVDGGTTTLTSQVISLTGLNDPSVRYARWYSNTQGSNPETKTFVVEVSSNGGGSWVNLETVGPTLSSPNPEVDGGWFFKTYRIASFVTPNAQFRIRFSASDVAGTSGSVVEAAIDAFSIIDYTCPLGCLQGDVNQDTFVDGRDVELFAQLMISGGWTPLQLCAGDVQMVPNGAIDLADVSPFVDILIAN